MQLPNSSKLDIADNLNSVDLSMGMRAQQTGGN
jgi:hypothetical protein